MTPTIKKKLEEFREKFCGKNVTLGGKFISYYIDRDFTDDTYDIESWLSEALEEVEKERNNQIIIRMVIPPHGQMTNNRSMLGFWCTQMGNENDYPLEVTVSRLTKKGKEEI